MMACQEIFKTASIADVTGDYGDNYEESALLFILSFYRSRTKK